MITTTPCHGPRRPESTYAGRMSRADSRAEQDCWSIGEAADAAGLTVDTLRYYEKAGLIPAIARRPGGQREYTRDDLGWVEFVRRLRATGMPVGELARYTRMVRDGDGTLSERRAILAEHRDRVRRAIDELVAARDVLDRKLASYEAAERGIDFDCSTAPLDYVNRIG